MKQLLILSAFLLVLIELYNYIQHYELGYAYFYQCERDGGIPVSAEGTYRGWQCEAVKGR